MTRTNLFPLLAILLLVPLGLTACTTTGARGYGSAGGLGAGAVSVEDMAGDSSHLRLASHPAAGAAAVWEHKADRTVDIYAARYLPGGGWQGAESIETGNGNAYEPTVGVFSDGGAVVVWEQNVDMVLNLFATSYVPGKGWQKPVSIEDGQGEAYAPQVAVAPDGSAVAVWVQHDGAVESVFAAWNRPGEGWLKPEVLEVRREAASRPQVAISVTGVAFAVWQQSDGQANSIYANRYEPGRGWTGAKKLEDGAGRAERPRMATDSAGGAVVVWVQKDGPSMGIYAASYGAATGWSTARALDSAEGSALSPAVAVTPGGSVVAVWQQSDGVATSIWESRRGPAGVWSKARLIEKAPDAAFSAHVAMAPSGAAVVVWVQNDKATKTNNVWSSRLKPGGRSFKRPVLIEASEGTASAPMGAFVGGKAVVVWTQRQDGQLNSVRSNVID